MDYRFPLITGLLLALSVPTMAAVYRQVDAHGNVTFTDEPGGGAEEIEVKPVTTITLPKPEAVQEQLEQDQNGGQLNLYDMVGFTSPNNDDAFHSGNGDVEFQVSSSPSLRRGHRFEVTLDGQPVGQTNSGTVTVRNVDRGTHRAGVHIINQAGQRIQTGEEITFTIHRPSVLRRNNN